MEKKQLTIDEVQEILNLLEEYINDLKVRWDQQGIKEKGWLGFASDRIINGTAFLLNCLDELIQFVEDIIPNGEDKKACVILVIGRLFDYVISDAFPIWLKPFMGIFKKIIIDVLVSEAIDFIVEKYNSGMWNAKTK